MNKSKNPKTVVMAIRLTPDIDKLLDQMAEERSLAKGTYIRQVLTLHARRSAGQRRRHDK